MKAVSLFVLLMLLVILAPSSPVAAETTGFFTGYAGSVPSSLVLLVSGLALVGVGVLMREWKRKWRL